MWKTINILTTMKTSSSTSKILILSSAVLFSSSVTVAGFTPKNINFNNNKVTKTIANTRTTIETETTTRNRICTLLSSTRKDNDNNPFTSVVKDMASSLMGNFKSSSSSMSSGEIDSKLSSLLSVSAGNDNDGEDDDYSWENIRTVLESKQTTEEQMLHANLSTGYGVEGSPLHKIRLFDKSNTEDSVRVTFYRDSASWCPYCQKVWITLEEKKIPYKIEKVNMRCYGDKPRSFLNMQPNGNIPVAIIDGTVYSSSNEILAALEGLFPNHKSLQPEDGKRARELLQLEGQLGSAWLSWLGSSANQESRFENVLKRVDNALSESEGPFFMGREMSMVDIQYISFLERACASLLYYKGFKIRVPKGEKSNFPSINKWFDALEDLPSYRLTKSDYYTHCWDLPPQLGGCVSTPEGEKYRNAINGVSGSWELPLTLNNDGIEPDWELENEDYNGSVAKSRREAVESISSNHGPLTKFASRGAGKKGFPPVMAPLADPNAKQNDAIVGGINSILQIISMEMLTAEDNGKISNQHAAKMEEVAITIVKDGGSDYANDVVNSLTYLRDRIGVPRDMRLLAARQLRAHLNWSIQTVVDANNDKQ